MVDLRAIFKAYDVRGVYPDQIDEEAARRIGQAFARFAGAPAVLLGRDMRVSGDALSAAFAEGVRSQG
ncbi:MAG: phosphomannomutase/phosphoglucomutase, partial [Actinomycetota bacterium]